jgi:hypothetical protein
VRVHDGANSILAGICDFNSIFAEDHAAATLPASEIPTREQVILGIGDLGQRVEPRVLELETSLAMIAALAKLGTLVAVG